MFFAVRETIRFVKWSPQYHLLAAASESGLCLIYDPLRQALLQTLCSRDDAGPFGILACSWFPSPTRKLLVLGGTSGCAEIWNVKTATRLRSYMEHSPEVKLLPPDAYPHRRTICALAWSPNRTFIASAGNDALVRVWRAATGETCSVSEELLCAGHLLTWLPDSKTLVSGNGEKIFVWNAFSGHVLRQIDTPLPYEQAGCRAVSPDGTKIVVVTGKAVVYDLVTGQTLLTYPTPASGCPDLADPYYAAVNGLIAWSPDGTRLAASFPQRRKHLYIWDACTGRTLLQHTSQGNICCLDWSFDSTMLAWGGSGYLETLQVPPN